MRPPAILRRAAQIASPATSRLLNRGPGRAALGAAEMFVAALQGKGAASGWDLDSEVEVALRFADRPQAVIFDVGANLGQWSRALLAKRPAHDVILLQFEPSSACCDHIRALGLPGRLFQTAVADESGTLPLYSPHAGSPSAALHHRRDTYLASAAQGTEEVEVTTLDAVIAEQALDRVDFVKLDIEGHELAALRGARASLEAGIIRALAFEFGSANIDTRTYFRDYWDFLTARGFALYRLAPGGVLLKIREYYEDLEYFRGSTNFVAALEGG
jgi:FkbM family methyltransferase